jgi:hypothetical protein
MFRLCESQTGIPSLLINKDKRKSYLCTLLNKQHAVKTYAGVEVSLYLSWPRN